MSIATMKRLNAISGLGFGVFLVMHFVTHYLLVWSWETARSGQLLFRQFYQQPVVELMVLSCLATHLYTNYFLYQARQRRLEKIQEKKEGKLPPPVSSDLSLHRTAGYALSLFMGGHIGATRLVPRYVLGAESASDYDYSFASKANELVPMNLFLVYYVVLGVAGGWHLIYGTHSALNTLGVGGKIGLGSRAVAVVSHCLILAAVLCLGGYVYPVDLSEKAALHDQVYKFMGMV